LLLPLGFFVPYVYASEQTSGQSRLHVSRRNAAQVTNFVTQNRKLALNGGASDFNSPYFRTVQRRFSWHLTSLTAERSICKRLLASDL